jgi:hypothetical protein
MKKFLKIFFGVVGGLLLLLIILPFFFVGTIEKKMKEEINKQLNATVAWDDVSLSLLRHFPDVSVGVEKLSVVGKGQFEKDTLAAVENFNVTVDLKSAFGDNFKIKSIAIDQLLVNAICAADSSVNWDIMLPSQEPEAPADTTSSSFMANLQSLQITNSRVYYIDRTMNLVTAIEGLDANMSGDLGASTTDLEIQASVKKLMVEMEKVAYLKDVVVTLKSTLVSDLDKMVFTFKNSDITLNQLSLGVDGSFGMPAEGYDLDMKIAARQNDFKAFLGLVPADLLKDYQSIQATGKLALEATLKGRYIDTDHMPAFDFLLDVQDGGIKYPSLPESVKDIQIKTKINNPGGSLDNTVTDVEKFHFAVAGNPFDVSLNVVKPISNATFKGAMKGVIDLGSLKKAIPLDSMTIDGIINADLALAGDYNMIEKELYEQIKADGKLGVKGFEFKSKDLPMPFYIDNAQLNFTPKFLDLAAFNSRLGQSDFNMSGRIDNYLAYALKDGVLKGSLNFNSKYINTDELMSLAGPEDTTAVADTAAMETVMVPKNIDFVLAARIDKLTYDKLTVNNAVGKITVKDGKVLLDGLNVNLLGGSMVMSGQYNTQDEKKPFVDFVFDASKININQAVNSFSVVDSLLPIAKLAKGLVNAKFSYSSLLGKDMSPTLSTINGLGNLKSESIEVTGSKIQAGLVSMLKDEKYNKLTAKDMLVNFKLENGNLIVSPFNVKINDKPCSFQGRQNIDKSMEYKMTMPVSRQEIARVGSLLGASVATSGDDLPVDIIIKGTLTKPQLSFSMGKATSQLKEEIKQEIKQEVQKEAEKAVEKLKEDPNVKKGVEDAKKKLKNLLK